MISAASASTPGRRARWRRTAPRRAAAAAPARSPCRTSFCASTMLGRQRFGLRRSRVSAALHDALEHRVAPRAGGLPSRARLLGRHAGAGRPHPGELRRPMPARPADAARSSSADASMASAGRVLERDAVQLGGGAMPAARADAVGGDRGGRRGARRCRRRRPSGGPAARPGRARRPRPLHAIAAWWRRRSGAVEAAGHRVGHERVAQHGAVTRGHRQRGVGEDAEGRVQSASIRSRTGPGSGPPATASTSASCTASSLSVAKRPRTASETVHGTSSTPPSSSPADRASSSMKKGLPCVR